VAVAFAAFAFAAGCGGEHDALEKQVSALRDEVVRLRASQAALGERMDAVDIDRGAFAKKGGVAGAATPPPAPAPLPASPRVADRPDLDVVKLSPNEGDGDVDGDPARPVVRAVGAVGEPAAKPPQTLSNKNLGARASKKAAAAAASKKDGDARPNVQP
jgi:hypothetical protein